MAARPPRFAALEDFAGWWIDDGRHTPCCLTARPDDVAQDSGVYDCAACPVRARSEALDDENRRAWRIYDTVCTRFTVETHTAGAVLTRLTAGDDEEDFQGVIDRLSLLYRVFNPRIPPHGA